MKLKYEKQQKINIKSEKKPNKREIKGQNYIFTPNNKSRTKWNETNIGITVGN